MWELGGQPPRSPAPGIGVNVVDSQGKYGYNLGKKTAKHALKQKNRSPTEKSRWRNYPSGHKAQYTHIHTHVSYLINRKEVFLFQVKCPKFLKRTHMGFVHDIISFFLQQNEKVPNFYLWNIFLIMNLLWKELTFPLKISYLKRQVKYHRPNS